MRKGSEKLPSKTIKAMGLLWLLSHLANGNISVENSSVIYLRRLDMGSQKSPPWKSTVLELDVCIKTEVGFDTEHINYDQSGLKTWGPFSQMFCNTSEPKKRFSFVRTFYHYIFPSQTILHKLHLGSWLHPPVTTALANKLSVAKTKRHLSLKDPLTWHFFTWSVVPSWNVLSPWILWLCMWLFSSYLWIIIHRLLLGISFLYPFH